MESVGHGGVDDARVIAIASVTDPTFAHTSELSEMSYMVLIIICYERRVALIGLGLVLV